MNKDELDAIVEDLYALYDHSTSIDVLTDYMRAAALAHGWYTRVRRDARASQILDGAGFEHEGAPLRRSMIEHALRLHWLADANDEAVNAVLAENQESWRKIQQSMSRDWSVAPEELDVVIEAPLTVSREMNKLAFKHLCERYGENDLYVAWLLETRTSHASYASARAYCDESDDGQLRLFSTPVYRTETTSAVNGATMLSASRGMNQFLDGQPWTERLDLLDVRLQEALHGG